MVHTHRGPLLDVTDAELSTPGDWKILIEARKGEFDSYSTVIDVPVRSVGP